jgi:phenylacetate-CoA ligase
VKPLLRYKTGDVVDLSFDAMRPAAATSRLRVFGRTRDKIRVADAEITALELEELALEGATSCVGYQYLLLEDAAGPAVRLEIEVLPRAVSTMSGTYNRDHVARRLGERLGVKCEVAFVDALDVKAATGSWVSWKAARLIDKRSDGAGDRSADQSELQAARTFTGAMTRR